MPNVAQVLKQEIARLARKEVKAQLKSVSPQAIPRLSWSGATTATLGRLRNSLKRIWTRENKVRSGMRRRMDLPSISNRWGNCRSRRSN